MLFAGIFSFCAAVFCTWVGMLMYHEGNYFLATVNLLLGVVNLACVMNALFKSTQ